MARKRPEILQGTLDLLILKTLALEPTHGWGIAKRIQQRSEDLLRINQGSLYPALYRLQDRGLIHARRGESDEGRPVKVYSLTSRGERQLAVEERNWASLSHGVELVLQES